ncbi:MAG: AAA family ATPase [Acidimicrobiales bacterium]|nr:AAA family ATPase [Acidimicrobiales bacterium]
MDQHGSSGASAADSVFVGRDHQLTDLDTHLDRCRHDQHGPLLIAGEPGIGKSRLLAELATRKAAEGWWVVWGRTWDEVDAPPFWIWTQVARDLQGLHRGTDLARVVLDEPEHTERFELFDATADLLRRSCSDRPVLVLLDDLHASDVPALLLTRFVAEQTSTHPVALIGTYRIADVTRRPEIRTHVDALVQAGTELRLGPLPREAIAAIVDDPSLADELHSLTGGNPLFVEQVMRLTGPDQLQARADGAEPTTDALRRAIRARIDTLTAPRRRVLVAAAVLGRSVGSTEIAELLTDEANDLHSALDQLVEAGLLHRTGGGGEPDTFDTVHALIAETALGSADPGEVAELHARAARAIGDDPERLGERAHHLLRAGHGLRSDAVDACVRAAEAASATASEDAIEHYERALHVLDAADATVPDAQARRLAILLELGRAQRRADRVAAADATFERAHALADELDDAESRALAALRGGIQYYFRGDVHGTPAERCQEALDRLPPGDSALRARLLADLSARLDTSTLTGESRRLATQAVDMARRLGDPVALGYALIAQQATDLGPRTLARRTATAREILVLARRAGDPTLAVQGRFLLLNALLERGDIRGLDAGITESPEAAGHLVDRNHARFALWLACSRALLAGDADRAEEVAERYLALAIDHGEPYAPRVFGGQLGAIRWLQGRVLELEQVYEDQARANPDEAMWAAVLASLRSSDGRFDAAREALAAIGDLGTVPDGMHWLVTMALAGEAAATAGDESTVAAYWEQLLPYADRFVPINLGAAVWGPVARPLGLLALRLGHTEEALSHLAHAIEVSARIGSRPRLVEAKLELAAALLETGRADDHRIAGLVAEARADADELGLTQFLERAEHLMTEVGRPSSRGAPSPPPQRPTISVLGTFEVASADGRVAKWSSRKARELLKILVARRGTPIHREVLMDLLWAGVEPEALGNRLSVALSTVRRTVDPDRSLPPGAFIAADRSVVWLRLDRVDVDAERYLGLAHEALTAHATDRADAADLLADAAAAHRGPALPDEPYAEWASALQSEVTFTQLRVLKALADQALAAGDDLVAADALQRLIESDPLDHATHTSLVTVLERIGAASLAASERRRYDATRTSP